MTLVDSGIGHTFTTATPLPLAGDVIDVTAPLHAGQINPIDSGGGVFTPKGAGNYTSDFFVFTVDGTNTISLTLNNGNDLLAAGVADNGATLRSVLEIYDSSQSLFATGTEAADTLSANYMGTLAAGSYFAKISSFGGHDEDSGGFEPAQYYDMGGYFLTGSGFALVPEPATGTLVLISFAFFALGRRRRSV